MIYARPCHGQLDTVTGPLTGPAATLLTIRTNAFFPTPFSTEDLDRGDNITKLHVSDWKVAEFLN